LEIELSKNIEKLNNIKANLTIRRECNFTGKMMLHHQHLSTRYMAKWIEAKNKDCLKILELTLTAFCKNHNINPDKISSKILFYEALTVDFDFDSLVGATIMFFSLSHKIHLKAENICVNRIRFTCLRSAQYSV
jgi:hypothetical protein